MGRRRNLGSGILRRLSAALALLCFFVIQGAAFDHVTQVDVLYPDHDQSDCAFCAANDRSGPPPQIAEPVLPAIFFAEVETTAPREIPLAIAVASLPPSRGPPLS